MDSKYSNGLFFLAGILVSVVFFQWGIFPTPVSDKQLKLMNENFSLKNQVTQLTSNNDIALMELKVCKAGIEILKNEG